MIRENQKNQQNQSEGLLTLGDRLQQLKRLMSIKLLRRLLTPFLLAALVACADIPAPPSSVANTENVSKNSSSVVFVKEGVVLPATIGTTGVNVITLGSVTFSGLSALATTGAALSATQLAELGITSAHIRFCDGMQLFAAGGDGIYYCARTAGDPFFTHLFTGVSPIAEQVVVEEAAEIWISEARHSSPDHSPHYKEDCLGRKVVKAVLAALSTNTFSQDPNNKCIVEEANGVVKSVAYFLWDGSQYLLAVANFTKTQHPWITGYGFHGSVWVDENGKVHKESTTFSDNFHLYIGDDCEPFSYPPPLQPVTK